MFGVSKEFDDNLKRTNQPADFSTHNLDVLVTWPWRVVRFSEGECQFTDRSDHIRGKGTALLDAMGQLAEAGHSLFVVRVHDETNTLRPVGKAGDGSSIVDQLNLVKYDQKQWAEWRRCSRLSMIAKLHCSATFDCEVPMEPPKGRPRPDEQLLIEDARQFVEFYQLLPTLPASRRRTLRMAIEESVAQLREGYSTMLLRLTRVHDHVWPDRPKWKGSGLSEVFREQVAGKGIAATEKGQTLFRYLRNLVTAYDRVKTGVRADVHRTPRVPTIRVGAPHTVVLRVLSAAFTCWRDVFGDRLNLELTIANSGDCIEQLSVDLLDLVVAYGPVKETLFTRRDQHDFVFKPFLKTTGSKKTAPAYLSRLVLIAHPSQPVYLKSGKDINETYWKRRYCDVSGSSAEYQKRGVIPDYTDLDPLKLDAMDLKRNDYIAISTWEPPTSLAEFFKALREVRGEPRCVNWHEEALALVRSQFGVAFVSEGVAKRRGVTAFRLAPEADFAQAIGIFSVAEAKQSREIRMLIEFLQEFLTRYNADIRQIQVPRFGDDDLNDFFTAFKQRHQTTIQDES